VFENDQMPPSFELEGELYQIRRASSLHGELDRVAVQRVLIAISHGDPRALAALRSLGVAAEDAAFALHTGSIAVIRRAAAVQVTSRPVVQARPGRVRGRPRRIAAAR
jgi:hypothetical protein